MGLMTKETYAILYVTENRTPTFGVTISLPLAGTHGSSIKFESLAFRYLARIVTHSPTTICNDRPLYLGVNALHHRLL